MTAVLSLAELPPSPFVREFGANYAAEAPMDILDMGCCAGRNALHLAKLGHSVVGISKEFEEVLDGHRTSELGQLACRFIVGDVRKLMLNHTFDAVLLNEVLQLMPKADWPGVLRGAQELTKIGGYNVVSGYFADPTLPGIRVAEKCFAPEELAGAYDDRSWNILEYCEMPTQVRPFGESQLVDSLVKLVAQRTS